MKFNNKKDKIVEVSNIETVHLLEVLFEMSSNSKLVNNQGIRVEKVYALELLGTVYVISSLKNNEILSLKPYVSDTLFASYQKDQNLDGNLL